MDIFLSAKKSLSFDTLKINKKFVSAETGKNFNRKGRLKNDYFMKDHLVGIKVIADFYT